MIPSYGESLANNPQRFYDIQTATARALALAGDARERDKIMAYT